MKEEDFLTNNYYKIEIHKLSEKMQRTELAIRSRASKLGLTEKNRIDTKKRRLWSTRDKQFLIDNYGKMKLSKIAKAVGRPEQSVITKANGLGLFIYKRKANEEKKNLHIPEVISNEQFYRNWAFIRKRIRESNRYKNTFGKGRVYN